MRTTVAVILLAGACAAAAQPAAPVLKPTAVTLKQDNAAAADLAAALSKSPAGVAVSVAPQAEKAAASVAFAGTPFWEALETTADRTKTRLALRDGGRSVVLEPRPSGRELSAVSGAFRVVPRVVTGRVLLETGKSFHEVQLDVHWEPRVPVFRIDSQPLITRAEDDRGVALEVGASASRHHPASPLTDMKVSLSGLTRDSKRIAVLAGEFRATAAEKMLTVAFKDLAGKFPATQDADGVKVVLRSFEKVAGTWEAEVGLTYPEGHPNFESFEEQKWLRDTRLRLVGPDGKPFDADNEDVVASGRNVTATYRYKLLANAMPAGKNWALVCETPGPLSEVQVPFVLKDVPIP